MGLGKAFAWLLLLAIIVYVVVSLMMGPGTEKQKNPYGRAAFHPVTGELVDVLRYPDCMDSDGGKNYGRNGATYNIYKEVYYEDYCEDPETLVEYFCNNQYPDRIIIPCKCFSGFCR